MTLQSSQERCNCLPYSLAALIFAHHAKLDAREGDGVTVGDTNQLWVPHSDLCARQLPRRGHTFAFMVAEVGCNPIDILQIA